MKSKKNGYTPREGSLAMNVLKVLAVEDGGLKFAALRQAVKNPNPRVASNLFRGLAKRGLIWRGKRGGAYLLTGRGRMLMRPFLSTIPFLKPVAAKPAKKLSSVAAVHGRPDGMPLNLYTSIMETRETAAKQVDACDALLRAWK